MGLRHGDESSPPPNMANSRKHLGTELGHPAGAGNRQACNQSMGKDKQAQQYETKKKKQRKEKKTRQHTLTHTLTHTHLHTHTYTHTHTLSLSHSLSHTHTRTHARTQTDGHKNTTQLSKDAHSLLKVFRQVLRLLLNFFQSLFGQGALDPICHAVLYTRQSFNPLVLLQHLQACPVLRLLVQTEGTGHVAHGKLVAV